MPILDRRSYFGVDRCKTLRCFFFFQAEDGIRDWSVTGVQTCALPIWRHASGKSEAQTDSEPVDQVGKNALAMIGNDQNQQDATETKPLKRGDSKAETQVAGDEKQCGNERSEERRVGKECRTRWWRDDE